MDEPESRRQEGDHVDVHEPIAISVAEAAERIGVSRAALYPLVMSGDIPSIKIGKRRLVPISALRGWVEQHTSPVIETGAVSNDPQLSQRIIGR